MFIANENFPFPSILFLRQQGFDIESIQELLPGISDEEVIKRAQASKRIILTFDRDYGEMIFRYAPFNPPAVVYFKEKGSDPVAAGKTLAKLYEDVSLNLANGFTVVESTSVRHRPYSG